MSFADRIADELVALGVSGDGVLVVHTAFSSFGGRAGAPADLIAALRIAAGSRGTVVMPSMSDDDEQPFDPQRTPCAGMGIVADTFWRMPGVRRSDSPHAFAAVGPHAAEITAPHPIDVPHGLNSPVGRAYDLDAEVLLLGVGHDANTTVHLAENIAGVRYKLPKYATVMRSCRRMGSRWNRALGIFSRYTGGRFWRENGQVRSPPAKQVSSCSRFIRY
jgi:aminoglycoside 3-N-acetyltransferase